MDLKTNRIANARLAIERAGGVGQVAGKMGYANASFLVQMFGPNPTRPATEKTVRKMEEALGLPPGALDSPPNVQLPPASATQVDTQQLAHMIHMVSRLAAEEGVKLTDERFASLVSLAYEEAYEEAAEHPGQEREGKIRQVVQLLK